MVLEYQIVNVDNSNQIESGEENCDSNDQSQLEILHDNQGQKNNSDGKEQILNCNWTNISILIVVNVD